VSLRVAVERMRWTDVSSSSLISTLVFRVLTMPGGPGDRSAAARRAAAG
jgi:hypothetical protein